MDHCDLTSETDTESLRGVARKCLENQLHKASTVQATAAAITDSSSGVARKCLGNLLHQATAAAISDSSGGAARKCLGMLLYEANTDSSSGVARKCLENLLHRANTSGVARKLLGNLLHCAEQEQQRRRDEAHRRMMRAAIQELSKANEAVPGARLTFTLEAEQARVVQAVLKSVCNPGKGMPGHPCSLPLYMSRGLETSQDLYLASSKMHGPGIYAAKWLQRAQSYCPEVVDNETVRDVYHYLDCLNRFPERTGHKFKFSAIVVFVDSHMDKDTLQRGLAVVPRHYVSYLNHAPKDKANAKISIRINGDVIDFLPWAQRVCPEVVESLAWDRPGPDSLQLRERLVGFSGLSALRGLMQRAKPKIELVITALQDIGAGQELLICYGTHDVTEYQNLQSINIRDEAHLRLIREQCVCHRKTVSSEDELLQNHMNRRMAARQRTLGSRTQLGTRTNSSLHVFAVALNEQLDHFGAFTTEDIPVGAAKQHKGIFFDGKLRKKRECDHQSYLILVGSRRVNKLDCLYVDGFDLISEYKQTQTNLLGVLWKCPDKPQHGTWRKFLQLSGGNKGVIESVPNMTGKGLTPSELQPVESFDVAAEAFLCTYLQRSTGEGVANMGMQLTWSYTPRYRANAAGEDRDRQTVSSEIARMSCHRGGHPRVIQSSAAAGQHKLEYFSFPGSLQQDQDQDTALVLFSIHVKEDEVLKQNIQAQLNALSESKATVIQKEERAIGALLGLAVEDALGAPLEFSQLSYKRNILTKMGQQNVWEKSQIYNKTFKVKSGQWTDDASMALCLADSLLVKRGFDPVDQRLRYHYWYYHSYNNAFGADTKRKSQVSIGLGENTELSMMEFKKAYKVPVPCTKAGDSQTSGNGPLMQSAPVPIFYASCSEDCVRYAYLQSRATHQGHEAAECSMLLAYILWKAINHAGAASTGDVTVHTAVESMVVREILKNLKQELEDTLMKARAETKKTSETGCPPLGKIKREGRLPGQRSEITRRKQSRWKLGLAQHPLPLCNKARERERYIRCTATYRDAVLKSANLGGDADTVSAITGQIAGAIYGVGAIPKAWVDSVQQWDRQGEIAPKVVRLYREGLQVSDQPRNSTLQASTAAASPGRSAAFSPLPAT
eukprot:g25638.t1